MTKILSILSLAIFASLSIFNINSADATGFVQKSIRQNSTAVSNNDPVTALKRNGLVLDISNVISDIGSLKTYIDSNISSVFVETLARLEETTKDIRISKNLYVIGDLKGNSLDIDEGGLKDNTILSKNITNGSIKLEDLDPTIKLGGEQVFQLNGNNVYYNDGSVSAGGSSASDKLEVVGNVKLVGSGRGIIFPDGTVQNSAITSTSDNVTLTGDQSIDGIKKFLQQLGLANTDVKVNKVSVDNKLLENKSTSIVSEKAIKEYIAYAKDKSNRICGLDNEKTMPQTTIVTTNTVDINHIIPNLSDGAKYSTISTNQTPTFTNSQIIVDYTDEGGARRTLNNIYDISGTIDSVNLDFANSLDYNDGRGMGGRETIYKDDNNYISLGIISSRSNGRSRSCGASCNDKNFAGSTNRSCLSGSCGAGRWASLNIKANGIVWTYIYQLNTLANSDFKFYNSIDLKNKTWTIVAKEYVSGNIVLNQTVNLPNPRNGLNINSLTGQFKAQMSMGRSNGSRSPNFTEPLRMEVVGVTRTSSLQSVTPTNLCLIGTPSALTTLSSGWNWSCYGINGGLDKSCSADAVQNKGILLINSIRTWSDGTYAKTCNEYKNNPPAGYEYKGDVGSGDYRIKPTGFASPTTVYCDMVTENGGWTRIYSLANYTIGANRDIAMPQSFLDLRTAITRKSYMQVRDQSRYVNGQSYFGFRANKFFTTRNENVFGMGYIDSGTNVIYNIVDQNGNYKNINNGTTTTGVYGVESGYLVGDIQYIDALRTNGHQWGGGGSRYGADSGLIKKFELYIKE